MSLPMLQADQLQYIITHTVPRVAEEMRPCIDKAVAAARQDFAAIMQSGAAAGCPSEKWVRPQFGRLSYPLPGQDIACPPNCDPCAFRNLWFDMLLFDWPQIEEQLYDTDTKINVGFPAGGLAPGGTAVISQEARRLIGYTPACVQVATQWTGGPPQVALITYQWSTSTKVTPATLTPFSNPQTGNQYECGDNCLKVPFPTYKGCDGWRVGPNSQLNLTISLAAAATSTLQAITVTVYHETKGGANVCCGACRAGQACGC